MRNVAGVIRSRLALALACGAVLALSAGVARAQQEGILVHGSGVVRAEPDMGWVTLGVTVTDADVQAALDRADAAMTSVRDALSAAGVARPDVRTVAFQVWREDLRDAGGAITGARYHVAHSYEVTVRRLGELGPILAGAVDAGANSVGDVRFGLADAEALLARARVQAMADARARAEQLAEQAGVALGSVLSIEEAVPAGGTPQLAYARVAGAGGGPPVEGGSLAVRVEVTVRYAIR